MSKKPTTLKPYWVNNTTNKPRHERRSFYTKEYHTTRWRKIRVLVLERDNYLCQDCKSKDIITHANTVDHVIPVRLGGEFYDSNNLRSLCTPCHNSKSGKEAHDKI